MALILFSISMFGNLSALRTVGEFRTRALISSQLLTKIGTGSCVMINLALFFCARDVLVAIFTLFFILGMLFATLWFFERRQIRSLQQEVPHFLDRWILNMKLGRSMSAARAAALREMSERASMLLTPLFLQAVSHPREHLILDEKVRRELIEMSHSPHSALNRLEHLRTWMRKTDEFRRKSGQAVRQTAIQSAVLLILLILLAIFTVQKYGWRNFDLVLASFLLSGLGIFTMRQLARKKRWKI